MASKKSATKATKKPAEAGAKKAAAKKAGAKKAGAATKPPALAPASKPAAAPAAAGGGGDVARHLINVDLAKVWDSPGKERKFVTVLGWGDEVAVLNEETLEQDGHVKVRTTKFISQAIGADEAESRVGYIVPKKGKDLRGVVVRKEDSRVLKVDFVDVQQGDGAVIITPNNRTILVDGGDNQMFARYLANRLNRFKQTSAAEPREIDCILVTHGDADHFSGLARIFESEKLDRLRENKRLYIYPKRVYHNGLVKRPGSLPKKPGEKKAKARPEAQMLGPTASAFDPKDGEKVTVVTGLVNSLIDEKEVPPAEMNEPFLRWREALEAYDDRCLQQTNQRIEFKRLETGMHDAFDFVNLDEAGNPVTDEALKIKVEVLAPMPFESGGVRGLKFLGEPPHGPRVGDAVLDTETKKFKSLSASHTINGHSVVFRMTYGGFSFLFTGDLNDEAGRALADAHRRGQLDLNAEVFKTPHHGSADFSGAFLQAVSPLVSVVSSGDESARKEYIHPRATIMGALGKFGRGSEPLVFVTELVAFFEVVGPTWPEWHKMDDKNVLVPDGKGGFMLLSKSRAKSFYAFRRTAFGLVRVRTDGQRMLVYTNSGQADLKEAYAYTVGRDGEPVPTEVVQV